MLLLVQLEKLHPKSFGQGVHLLLVLSLAFEEEDEVADQQHAAVNRQEHPEGRKGDDVYQSYDYPEEDWQELAQPEDGSIASRRHPHLR